MIILCDTRQQANKHKLKDEWFEKNDIEVRRTKLYVGDYTLPANQSVCVDTKKDVMEIVGDICGKQHERFRSELLRAKEADIQLYILVENESFTIPRTNVVSPYIGKLEDLHKWVNPRLWIRKNGKQAYPNATRGVTLMKAAMSMEKRYGVRFVFCRPKDAGQTIIDLLTGGKP